MFDPNMCRAFVQMMADSWTDGLNKRLEIFFFVEECGHMHKIIKISHLDRTN